MQNTEKYLSCKSREQGESKTAWWESQEDNGMPRHALHKTHIQGPHDFDLCTTSKTFLSCLSIAEANPTTLLLQKIQLGLLQLPGALILLPFVQSSRSGQERKVLPAPLQPQLASLPNTAWGIPLPRVSDQKFPLQIRLLNPQCKTAVRSMIYCSFHPESLAMAPLL